MRDSRAKVRVGDAGEKGKGAFACAPIAPLSRVISFNGRPKWIWDIPRNTWPHTFQVDYDRYVIPRRNGAGWAVNHSCEPNCVVLGWSLLTRRRIEEGEELTFDYSTDVDWPGFRMRCKCGSPRCRGVVRAYRFLPTRLKIEYGKYVASYILQSHGSKMPRRRQGPPTLGSRLYRNHAQSYGQ